MRVLAVCHKAYYGLGHQGGAETYLHSLMKYFLFLGWEARAVCFGKKPETQVVEGVRVHRRKASNQISDLARWADVIVTQLGGTGAGRAAAKEAGIPLVQIIHNTSKYSVGFLGSGVDLAIYNSLWVRDFHEKVRESRLIQVWQRPGKSTVQARSQRSWDSVVVRPPTEGEYIPMGKPDGKITLVNLTPNKGPDLFYELAEHHNDLQFMGVIGGYEQDQQDVRHRPNVTIHPHTEDIDAFYSQASVVILPSRYESYGRVAVEAMQRGIPVIASDTTGLRECLGPEGLTYPREDTSSWSDAISMIFKDYDAAVQRSKKRYLELCEFTPGDLQGLTAAMKGLKNGTGNPG